jgi:hypothetical protein
MLKEYFHLKILNKKHLLAYELCQKELRYISFRDISTISLLF